MIDAKARFWAKVAIGPGCWEWQANRTHEGYGQFWLNGRQEAAHRAVLRLEGVTVPSGAVVLHLCDNPPCVRPEHLRIGTQADNVRDGIAKGHTRCLSIEQVRAARAAAAAGQTQTVIAASLGVSQAAISRIVRGLTWADI